MISIAFMKYDARIELRMAKDDKKRLREIADRHGLTLSGFLYKVGFLYANEVPPTEKKEKMYAGLQRLCSEINAIGKNINQLIPVLRGIYADRKIEDGEYRKLLNELERYNDKREIISKELYKYMF